MGEILKSKICVGHSLKNDFSALMLDHPKSQIPDTAKYKPFMGPVEGMVESCVKGNVVI